MDNVIIFSVVVCSLYHSTLQDLLENFINSWNASLVSSLKIVSMFSDPIEVRFVNILHSWPRCSVLPSLAPGRRYFPRTYLQPTLDSTPLKTPSQDYESCVGLFASGPPSAFVLSLPSVYLRCHQVSTSPLLLPSSPASLLASIDVCSPIQKSTFYPATIDDTATRRSDCFFSSLTKVNNNLRA